MKIYLNENALESLDEIINSNFYIKRILVITGKKSYNSLPFKFYFETLQHRKPIQVDRYHVNGKLTQYDEVLSFVKTAASKHYDIIVAIGGGVVMDFAKLTSVYMYNLASLEGCLFKLPSSVTKTPLVCIPTTSGSGSEATHFAVLYIAREKKSISSISMLPDYTIVDPTLTYGLPKSVASSSGIDALCQSIESLWALAATEESRHYAKLALDYIVPSIVSSIETASPDSRERMAIGSYYAGKAINISKTTAPHAFSYYLTERHDIPHGEAVAMNISVFIEYNYDSLQKSTIYTLFNAFGVKSKSQLITTIEDIKSRLGLRSHINEIGSSLSISDYFENINIERLNNNPKPINLNEIRDILTL